MFLVGQKQELFQCIFKSKREVKELLMTRLSLQDNLSSNYARLNVMKAVFRMNPPSIYGASN